MPCGREGVIGVLSLVLLDRYVEPLLADIAPWTHCVADYINLVVGHSAQCLTESQFEV